MLGYRSDAHFSEILANISGDLQDDGILDSESTLLSLVGHARSLDASLIRAHVNERYETLGRTVTLGDFEAALETFLDQNADLPEIPLLNYQDGSFLALLADGEDGMEVPKGKFELRVDSPGVPLRVVISSEEGEAWGIQLPVVGWIRGGDHPCSTSFEVADVNASAHVILSFPVGTRTVQVYEGRQDVPSWTRQFTVPAGPDDGPLETWMMCDESGMGGASAL